VTETSASPTKKRENKEDGSAFKKTEATDKPDDKKKEKVELIVPEAKIEGSISMKEIR